MIRRCVLLIAALVLVSACQEVTPPDDSELGVSDTVLQLQGPYQQGTDGRVMIEAEGYSNNVAQGGHTWDLVTSPAGYSGGGAMQANPNIGTNHNTGYAANSPRLDYQVTFVKTGTHYLWLRGAAATNLEDSVHVGLDGAELGTSDRIQGFNPTWTWSHDTIDGPVATFTVASTGLHTVNVWMREDGFAFDRLVVTNDASYDPSSCATIAQGADGMVAFETEDYCDHVAQGGHSWNWVTSPAGYSGSGAMQAGPEPRRQRQHRLRDGQPAAGLPGELRQDRAPTTSGCAGAGATNTDDSCHVGLDGGGARQQRRHPGVRHRPGPGRTTPWTARSRPSTWRAPGSHMVNLWMREDGFVADQLIITNDAGYDPDPACATIQQGADGKVTFEAEEYCANVPRAGTPGRWWRARPGYSGSGAMQAGPEHRRHHNTGYVAGSPRLDYQVSFVKTGTHYVWVRGAGATNTDDSCHVGLDGAAARHRATASRGSARPGPGRTTPWTDRSRPSPSRAPGCTRSTCGCARTGSPPTSSSSPTTRAMTPPT